MTTLTACQIYGIHPAKRYDGDYSYCALCDTWFMDHPDGDGSLQEVKVSKVDRWTVFDPNTGIGMPHIHLYLEK